MKIYKIIAIILMVLSDLVVHSQNNDLDSLFIERESLNGYYSQNKQFCDKLEEFINVVDLVYSTDRTPLILITNMGFNCDCGSDSLSVVRIEIKDKDFLSVFMEIDSNEIYLYGGKLKGRYVFLKQKSIFGKLFRSDFGFIDVLKEVDPYLAKNRSRKYDKSMDGGGCPILIGQPFMDLFVDRNGNIDNIKYYQNDARGFITYDNINAYKKSLLEPVEYIPRLRRKP